VLTLACVWSVGRAAGAVAGELDRGTMELLLSQPIPRNRLILAHFLADCVVIPALCLSFWAGTEFGLWVVGPFEIDYTTVREVMSSDPRMSPVALAALEIPTEPTTMEVSGRSQFPALANLAALMFALSGLTLALSAAGRSRWKVIGLGVLVAIVMFVANVLGQLWDAAGFVRPFTVFYYYQPQKIMLRGEWLTDLGAVWNGGRLVAVPAVGVLLAVGAAGYLVALRIFTRRDLPAPL
jgi:ABC-2 type transport system permease protein